MFRPSLKYANNFLHQFTNLMWTRWLKIWFLKMYINYLLPLWVFYCLQNTFFSKITWGSLVHCCTIAIVCLQYKYFFIANTFNLLTNTSGSATLLIFCQLCVMKVVIIQKTILLILRLHLILYSFAIVKKTVLLQHIFLSGMVC